MAKANTTTTPDPHADFLEGRDLAVATLREAGETSLGTIEAQYREGAEQDNFLLRRIQQIIARPELAPGFCAVLSDWLSVNPDTARIDANHYARLTVRQMLGAKAYPKLKVV